MLKLITQSLFVALLLSSGVLQADQPLVDDATAYSVQAIEDGDTLLLLVEGNPTRVQIMGIDAPESLENAKFKLDLKNTGMEKASLLEIGEASTSYMLSLVVVGERVSIHEALGAADCYGRIPAIVYNREGRDLGDAMIADGYAVVLKNAKGDYEYIGRLSRLERVARKSSAGLWGSHSDSFRNWYERTR